MGVGQRGRGAGGPQRQPVGRRAEASFTRRQAQGITEGGVARGNRGGSGGPAQRGANPRPGATSARNGRMNDAFAQETTPIQPLWRSRITSVTISYSLKVQRDKELVINPVYQRYFRWDLSQKTRFVESLLLGIPIPPIFVYTTSGRKWE